MINSQYINDIITLLLDDDKYYLIKKQIKYITEESFEYTGSGVFVNFKHEEKALSYISDSKHLRLGGVLIKSDEIDIAAEASIVINNGIIDYLEIWSYGDTYPCKDLTHYTLEQQWNDESDNKIVKK